VEHEYEKEIAKPFGKEYLATCSARNDQPTTRKKKAIDTAKTL
jgi:hypothetical protein